jgi:hypothetical protein
MKKFSKKTLLIIAFIISLPIACVVSNPLRSSEDSIKNSLLRDVPIGTQMQDVILYIQKKKYKIDSINDFGFPDKDAKYIGYKSIRSDLGDYVTIFTTNVTVFWGFDEESKLIDVRVWKIVNAL